MKLFSKKNRNKMALEVIYSHLGKKRVYETYLRKDPGLAEKYLNFIAENAHAIYIHWDNERKAFAG